MRQRGRGGENGAQRSKDVAASLVDHGPMGDEKRLTRREARRE